MATVKVVKEKKQLLIMDSTRERGGIQERRAEETGARETAQEDARRDGETSAKARRGPLHPHTHAEDLHSGNRGIGKTDRR